MAKAKATAMDGEAFLRATSASARAPDRRPDLLTTAVLAVLDVTLEALRVPALIIGQRGEVICSNAAARTFLGDRPRVVRWSPPPANASGRREPTWEVTPIHGPPDWSIVILRTPEAPPGRWNLTARQREVLELVARGMTNTSIAETLGLRRGTVEFHISAIFDKVGVNNRAALIASVMGG